MFKVGDTVKHYMTTNIGTITEIVENQYRIKWENAGTHFGYTTKEFSLISSMETKSETKKDCVCDSRQLFSFGHEKTCTQYKKRESYS
jgi:hypothetical protein